MTQINQIDFGKVAVLLGGLSAEREVSLNSGNAVIDALRNVGVDAIAFDPKSQPFDQLKAMGVDRVLNTLHGRGGEDGLVQALLQNLNIPCTGSNVASSALSMDKWRSKLVWQALGLPVASSQLINKSSIVDEQLIRRIIAKLGPITFVKPSHEGSSVGMSKAQNEGELKAAIELALTFDDEVLVEAFIDGREYTVSILNDKALPSISMVTPREFYDYEAKYQSNETQYFCPSGLNEDEETELQNLAIKAFKALGCSGWGRVDFIREKQTQKFKLLEVNTVPGMTKTSLVPKAAKQAGISFDDLVLEILKTSL